MIRIIVVEDHVVVREGIICLLNTQEDFIVAGEAGNGLVALGLLNRGLSADVVLTDLNMPEMNGIVLTQGLTVHYPSIAVIVLSLHNRQEYIDQAFRAGAKGYVQKGGDAQNILSAIREVYAGKSYYGT